VQEYVELFKKIIEESYRVLVTASTPAEFLVVIVAVALIPALCEEFLFRGLVQSSFAEVAGEGRSAMLAGIIFGAYHLNPLGIVPLVVLGAFFGFLVYRSGSIFLAVSAHFFNNFIAVTATYLQLDDEFVMLAPHGGAGASLQVLNFGLSAVAFAGAIALFLYLTEPKEQ
jgi:membrane protease YdiL (CAAX protease family)